MLSRLEKRIRAIWEGDTGGFMGKIFIVGMKCYLYKGSNESVLISTRLL